MSSLIVCLFFNNELCVELSHAITKDVGKVRGLMHLDVHSRACI